MTDELRKAFKIYGRSTFYSAVLMLAVNVLAASLFAMMVTGGYNKALLVAVVIHAVAAVLWISTAKKSWRLWRKP